MKGMVLAAGFGTRLGRLGELYPKPALPVHGIPLAGYSLHLMAEAGIRDVAVNLHYRPDVVRHALGDGSRFGVRITYFYEEEILGTGGALKNVADWLGGDDLLVMNGKIVTTVDLTSVMEFHRQTGSFATMVVRPDPHAREWGAIGVDPSDGRIVDILGEKGVPYMFTGISIVSARFVERLPQGPSCAIRQGWIPSLKEGHTLHAYVLQEDYWWEHSTPARYLMGSVNLFDPAIRKRLPFLPSSREGLVVVGSPLIPPGRYQNTVIHEGSEISEGLVISNSVILPGARVTEDLSWSIALPDGVIPVNPSEEGGFRGPRLGTPDSRRG